MSFKDSKQKVLPAKEQLEIRELKARIITSCFASFTAFLIPIVIAVATYKFNSTQLEVNSSQNRLSQQQSCIKENLELWDRVFSKQQESSPDKSEQLRAQVADHAALLAQICVSVGIQLPGSVQKELARTGRDSENATTRSTAQNTLEIQAAALTTSDPAQIASASTGSSPARQAVPARVYFLIPTDNQKATARELANKLEQQISGGSPILVPGIQTGEANNKLRCFKKAECPEARDIMKVINNLLAAPQFDLEDLSVKYENSTAIRPRHYELWFSKDPIKLR
jgi:hypothetical protein